VQQSQSLFDIELASLLEAVHRRYHYDFRHYSGATLRRRLTELMQRLDCRSLSAVQEKVLREPDVFHQFLSSLTIQVSSMFRDPLFYRALRENVTPLLQTYPSLKLWVAGCSTGEELYSIAIVLYETGLLGRTLIYATDINADALAKAEAGVYALDRMAQFSEAYLASGGRASLADYYTAAYGAAKLDPKLRKDVVFADHSLATDSVFAEVQLVSCRNVLIYFDRDLQDRAIGLFKDSVCRKGFLCLGSSETLQFSSAASKFVELDTDQRIYQRR
jgi:chemotaxis protein methyltransferase CheR